MMLDRDEVMKVLPHRGAMLMIDGIEELDYGRKVVGYRDVRDDEFWCDGHFPARPIFPGVLIIEMMAQLSAFLFAEKDETAGRIAYIAKVEEVKFLKNIFPGSRIVAEALFNAEGAGFIRTSCKAMSDGREAARGKLTCYLSTGSSE